MKLLIDATPVETYVIMRFLKIALEQQKQTNNVVSTDMPEIEFKRYFGTTKRQFEEAISDFETEVKKRSVL
jgi:hypothetical protein